MSKINTYDESCKLAQAVVTSAKIIEQHFRFNKEHNYAIIEAMLKAAAEVKP